MVDEGVGSPEPAPSFVFHEPRRSRGRLSNTCRTPQRPFIAARVVLEPAIPDREYRVLRPCERRAWPSIRISGITQQSPNLTP